MSIILTAFLAITPTISKNQISLSISEFGYIFAWIFAVVTFAVVMKYTVAKKVEKDDVYSIIKEQVKSAHDSEIEIKKVSDVTKGLELDQIKKDCESCKRNIEEKISHIKEMNEQSLSYLRESIIEMKKSFDIKQQKDSMFQDKVIEFMTMMASNNTSKRTNK